MIFNVIKYILLLLTAVALTIGIIFILPIKERTTYDCSLAEFHPDVPAEIKEECRKLRVSKRYILV